MSRALELESTAIEAYDKLGIVGKTLLDLLQDAEVCAKLDKAVASQISGCALVVQGVCDELNEVLESEA